VLLLNGKRLDISGAPFSRRITNSLGCDRGCLCLVEFWETGSLVRSNSGPELKIWGREGRQVWVEVKKPQPKWSGLRN